MGLIPGLSTSLSGMKVAQGQLELIGRNIANVDTPGYTRKYAQQTNVILAGSSMGVSMGEVRRSVSEGLLKSFLGSNSVSGDLSIQNQYLSKTEILLGTPQGDNSIASNVASLQTAFNTFASDVTSSAGRYNLLNQANTMTSRLNSISAEIQKLRGDADVNISANVAEINAMLDDLDRLNDDIVKYSIMGYDGKTDLLDKRDQVLRELSGKIDINYFTRETGELVIQTTNGITLLDSEPHKLSHNAIAQGSATTSYASGGISGIMVDGKDITKSIKGGEMKGLIDIRDTTLPSLQAQLDELAGTLKQTINQIHNQGTAFPNTPSELIGNRTFIDSANQSISIENGDVRITIFDSKGKQTATTTLRGGLGFENGSIDDMNTAIQDWMRSPDGANLPQASVSINDKGKLVVNTGDSNYGFSVMDETLSTPGSPQQDVTIKFDSNGNGLFDKEMKGFSSFFGLNDFFVSNTNEAVYDSKVLSANANLGLTDITTWSFSDSENGLNYGTINIAPGDSIQDIANAINSDPTLSEHLNAALVPNGDGYVLRITNVAGNQLEIAENVAPGGTPSNLINKLGLAPSNAGVSSSLSVREDLKTSPQSICGGSPEFDSSTGDYKLNPASNNIANALAKVFSESQDFKQSGTISQTQATLANYASTFVGNIASQTSNALSSYKYQAELTNSIATKEAQIGGVDVDEELGQMIIFQQTYAACAQAFTASKEMLDVLLGIV